MILADSGWARVAGVICLCAFAASAFVATTISDDEAGGQTAERR
jgi:hypothetical protein